MALNSDMPWPSVEDARSRVLDIQKKLHRWTKADSAKRFEDLFNLVCDRAMLVVAWDRVRSNRGSKTAGVDGRTRWYIEHRLGVARFLEETRVSLKEQAYRPAPVREHGIPKAGGKVRYLGIPTIQDRVVQMALKLVLEPIFEVDFCPTSFGYRRPACIQAGRHVRRPMLRMPRAERPHGSAITARATWSLSVTELRSRWQRTVHAIGARGRGSNVMESRRKHAER
jgi:retron-type reverse transcriptase